ncbi:hypothetical protein GQ607_013310 [Colletotrichum asianum]|uniref:Uncharacterized protein n=1 Tax=Colletotrichum asianum TaxID=702518 RepID=A0A8H3W5E0_9PEZI|nr:hypothetical protein GQ607_013310 [Colletotrichum asianum]
MRGSGRASVVPVPACPRARRANRPGPLLRSMREKRAVMCNTTGAQRHLLNPPVHPWAWLSCTAETRTSPQCLPTARSRDIRRRGVLLSPNRTSPIRREAGGCSRPHRETTANEKRTVTTVAVSESTASTATMPIRCGPANGQQISPGRNITATQSATMDLALAAAQHPAM